ncbi:MAG: lamin tail domain-containing protein [bacterium]
MRRVGICIFIILSMSGCGPLDLSGFDSLLGGQPKVVSVKPAEGDAVSADAVVELAFSKALNPSTVDSSTLAIMKVVEEGKTHEEIASDIEDGDAKGIDGVYEFRADGGSVSFRAGEAYEPGATYLVVATGKIMSLEGLPLNQRPGMSPRPFTSSFTVEGIAENGAAGSGTSGDSAGGDSETAGNTGGSGSATGPARPEALVINELMYDAAGSDTEGDLFIELYGDAGGDLSGYKVVFINGADGKATETVAIPDGTLIPDDGIFLIADAKTGAPGTSNVSGADLIENFDPHNSPDCVQLLDEKEAVLDAMGYGTPIVTPASNGKPCFEGTPATKTGAGQSLSRNGGLDTDDNVSDFVVLQKPSPGTL